MHAQISQFGLDQFSAESGFVLSWLVVFGVFMEFNSVLCCFCMVCLFLLETLASSLYLALSVPFLPKSLAF